VVRLVNLPQDVKRSQLEEVISPYGHILDLQLELRSSDGDESV